MQIEDFIAQFESRQLPKSEWTHAAHIRTALWYVYQDGLDSALCQLRSGIISYNVSVGGENTPEGGYHETLTLFWTYAVAGFIEEQESGLSFETLWQIAQSSKLLDKKLPFEHYSKEHLMSIKARGRWVEPDLKAFRGLAETK